MISLQALMSTRRHSMTGSNERHESTPDTKWLDGFRGLAAFEVTVHHLVWALNRDIFSPNGQTGILSVLQLPFVRLLIGGRFGIAQFAILTGCVGSLRPIALLRDGNKEDALKRLSKASFKRLGRFTLPVTFMTFVAWTLCQLGAFNFSHQLPFYWISDTSPASSPNVLSAFGALLSSIVTTWTSGENVYEKNFWMLASLLKGSLTSYLVLLMMTFLQFRGRCIMLFLLWCLCFYTSDVMIGINIFFGMTLTEIMLLPRVQSLQEHPSIPIYGLSFVLILLGSYLASYPLFDAEKARWSDMLLSLAQWIFPKEYQLYYLALGAQTICLGLLLNPLLRKFLSCKFLIWMGKVSWPVYLIHGTLIRTMLMPLAYSHDPVTNEYRTTPLKIAVLLPIFYVVLYSLAHLWTLSVDPMCDKLANWIESKVFRFDVVDKIAYIPLDNREETVFAIGGT